jgi:hypothetical protein
VFGIFEVLSSGPSGARLYLATQQVEGPAQLKRR